MKKVDYTIKQLSICFGERIGHDVRPSQLRIRGNWLFYKSDFNDSIECYYAKNAQYNSGILCSEPWDDCKLSESPFIPHNQDKVFNTLKRLDKEYQEYLKEYS
tara:strand:+ start:94 stop:402 length:309 start_codon:yes stop_codon:yes gene_type:complete